MVFLDVIERELEGRVRAKRTVFDRDVDARQRLVDDAAGADVHMADFGVAHLTLGKANGFAGSFNQSIWILGEQIIEMRLARDLVGVARGLLADGDAVHDNQCDRFLHVVTSTRSIIH